MSYQYKLNRTQAYLGTVTDRNHPMVHIYRDHIKQQNADGNPPRYIKLQARGPRPSRRYHQSLPLDMGTHFDIYVYNRY